MSRLLTPAEVADRLRLKCPKRVYAMIASGTIKASNVGRSRKPRWLIREIEVEAFIDRREKVAAPVSRRRNTQRFSEVKQYV